MREVSHTEMVTMVRNCEGEILARIEGEEVCCNPTPEVDAEIVEVIDVDEPGESQGETQEPVEGGQEAVSE